MTSYKTDGKLINFIDNNKNTEHKKKLKLKLSNFYLVDDLNGCSHVALIDSECRVNYLEKYSLLNKEIDTIKYNSFYMNMLCNKNYRFKHIRNIYPHDINFIDCQICLTYFKLAFQNMRLVFITVMKNKGGIDQLTIIRNFLLRCNYCILDYNPSTKLFALSQDNKEMLSSLKSKDFLNTSPVYADTTGLIYLAEDDFIFELSNEAQKKYNQRGLVSKIDSWYKL